MIRLFIKECLLFGSRRTIDRFLGVVAWIGAAMFMYAIGMLVFILLKRSGPE
jgi:hypothetical protein